MTRWTLAFALALAACGHKPTAHSAADAADLRKSADGSTNTETLGEWLLAEQLAPQGSAKDAERARKQLGDALAKQNKAAARPEDAPGMIAGLAVGLYDETHGHPETAAAAFVDAVVAAREATPEDGAVYGWFAASHLVSLRGSVRSLFKQHEALVTRMIAEPRALGWRGAAVLLEWAVAERVLREGAQDDALDRSVTAQLGCATQVGIAGPFGSGVTRDLRTSWPAEASGPWPATFAADPTRGTTPKRLKTDRARCTVGSATQTADGVFYAQTFFETREPRTVLVSVQGAHEVWVDDVPILRRDLRQFGVWQRFGANAVLSPGRHRVLARIASDQTAIRLLHPDGTSLGAITDDDGSKPYGLEPPRLGPNPNPLEHVVATGPSGSPFRDLAHAYLAHVDGLDDVASWLIEPHIKTGSAGPVMLEFAALFARGDAAFGEEGRRANEKALHERAVRRDPNLWYSQAWLALDEGERQQPLVALDPLQKLAARFPNQPELSEQLVRLYARLGYDAERLQIARKLGAQFPDDVGTQKLLFETVSALGSGAEADDAAARVAKLDPDSELGLEQALVRLDFKAALAELERLKKRKPNRKDIATRIASVLLASGDPRAAIDELAKAVKKNPDDPDLRLRLADRAYASGDKEALRRALAESIASGSKALALRDAVELLEGRTALEPYRQTGKKVIAEFTAWEKAGHKMDGSAARVLDYSALWIHPDGSSEMLEHEILKVQTQEAIGREAEQSPPGGLVLALRVIKADGSTLEPMPVQGKATLTMPHLEVGDFIEIEHITRTPSESRGLRYNGPTWFFREADKGYWRSEFITLAPSSRKLLIETRGAVPAPIVTVHGSITERRWLVKESPPAPEEPNSPPPQEFLPSVRLGWGISLESTVAGFARVVSDETVRDPRFTRRAEDIVRGIPKAHVEERALRLYREVLNKIQDGQETDGRRVLNGGSGSRQAAFTFLLRQLGIEYDYALVQNKLAAPSVSALSEVDGWNAVALRVHGEKGPRWLTVRDRFAPFGYLPAELRGQPAIVLTEGLPRTTTPAGGMIDELVVEGRAELARDGSAKMELREHFQGKLAISMRNVIDKVPEAQLPDFVETRLVGSNIPGFRVREVKVEKKDDLDAPVTLLIRGDVSELAKRVGQSLIVKPIFPLRLSEFAELAERQTTLLLASASRLEVKFLIVAADGLRLPASLPQSREAFGDAFVQVSDRTAGQTLTLSRMANVPAARIAAGEPYRRFASFARNGDAIFEREIVLGF